MKIVDQLISVLFLVITSQGLVANEYSFSSTDTNCYNGSYFVNDLSKSECDPKETKAHQTKAKLLCKAFCHNQSSRGAICAWKMNEVKCKSDKYGVLDRTNGNDSIPRNPAVYSSNGHRLIEVKNDEFIKNSNLTRGKCECYSENDPSPKATFSLPSGDLSNSGHSYELTPINQEETGSFLDSR